MAAREALRLAQSKYDGLMARIALGSVKVNAGEIEEGMKVLDQAREELHCRRLNMISFAYWPEVVYGRGLISMGRLDAGIDHLEAAHQRFLELGNRRAASLAALALGEAYLPPGSSSRSQHAARPLREALRLAQDKGMDGLAARALVGLASLA